MATPLAPHVSRVSGDYAPHGYSVMDTSTVLYELVAGATDDQYVPLAFADQSDIYLEAGSITTVDAIASHASHYWTFDLVTGPNGLASETSLSSSVGGASTPLAELTEHGFTITAARAVIPKGQAIWLKCNPNHASSPAATVAGHVRVRIKA